ncbi:MAG: hypothetical protein MUC51_08595 [Anaerolineae bacterium]|jgi:hypothetical protein|nr:hypothetical protein [Anaerolineae bacterium]
MHDTRLIFVEGLPGLGKTTTASWLATRLRAEHLPVRLYLESQPGHPINVGGDLHPAGDVTGETYFQQYRPASFIQESLERWQAFVDDATQADTISVLDSYPFQNSVRILLQMDAALDDMRAYAAQVEALVMPLRPVLIYLSHRDVAHSVQHFSEIGAQRGAAWMDYVARLIAHCPYGAARHLEGTGGVLAFMGDYKQLTDALLRESRLPRIVLKDCAGEWNRCYRQIEAFLDLAQVASH